MQIKDSPLPALSIKVKLVAKPLIGFQADNNIFQIRKEGNY